MKGKNLQSERRKHSGKARLILTELEKAEKTLLFVFSKSGFTKDAITYMEEYAMAWTE
ncbi:MAG: hypothetical protein R2941_18395 [Desulfobacterales bacterium]